MTAASRSRRAAAEFAGTAFLVCAVVGSGVMAERLAGGNVAVALLCNTIATAAALFALILTFGPISGGHFNPAVTIVDAWQRGVDRVDAAAYVVAQCAGGIAGAIAAHLMFGLPAVSWSTHVRAGAAQCFGELVATFGLVAVIWGCTRRRPDQAPIAVAAYIAAAYWFTSSTSFANPAVTLARAISDTFAGIRPVDTPAFIAAQLLGAAAATWFMAWLAPDLPARASDVVVAHEER